MSPSDENVPRSSGSSPPDTPSYPAAPTTLPGPTPAPDGDTPSPPDRHDAPSTVYPTTVRAPEALPATTDHRALRLPGYEVLDELGRGGMGVVYRARQTGLNRLVALKMVLAGSHASAQDLIRLRLEAEALASLRHPNIVQVFEVGQDDGRPFFSMEFVEGGSLAARLRGRPLAPDEAARLLEVLARSAHAAHQAGVVHR